MYNECFLGFEAADRINSAVLGARQGHRFMTECMRIINERYDKGRSYMIAPEVATAACKMPEVAKTVKLYDQEYFYPYNPYDRQRSTSVLMYMDVTDRTYAIHHWNKSWSIGVAERLHRIIPRLFK